MVPPSNLLWAPQCHSPIDGFSGISDALSAFAGRSDAIQESIADYRGTNMIESRLQILLAVRFRHCYR